jgi:hypothetical protein
VSIIRYHKISYYFTVAMKKNKFILDKLLLESQKAAHILFTESKVIAKWPEIIIYLQEIEGGVDTIQVAKQEYGARTIANKIQASDIIKQINSYVQIVLLDETIIPLNTYQSIYEEKVKSRGEIWIIHKGDPDSFPSNPHAHNYDAGVKPHLGNGYLFHGKKEVGRIKPKHLQMIRQKIKGIALPALKINMN